ncbi:hypothetical protein Rhe02_78090 [Rhizocola hellebori]|uniref:Uncharacterized protein n=1 Tax=Rhizocola hellebori TaxID=1392758 RepID=A0A8J3QHJ3_9ACTN|nr:hypothetical protein [Rhizocola hellebori]GIH09742.1 hypothetical protein Rhe02_78090 [Rhizocola hellebori]
MDGVEIPAVLRSLITTPVAHELAKTYTDQVVFPEKLVIDRPDDPHRRFPGWPTAVLVIADENQGVCSWGVPLGEPEPRVLVGGELEGINSTVVYAPDVASYLAARRWDYGSLDREPLLQAQADPLDEASLAHLRAGFDEQPRTHGWPGHTQFRFQRDGVKILLWSGTDQCDWWLSAVDEARLAEAAARLVDLSDLRTSLWANDIAGEALLERLTS